jgi:hypothetical protein
MGESVGQIRENIDGLSLDHGWGRLKPTMPKTAVAGFSSTHSSLRFLVPRTNSEVFLDPISVLDSGDNVQTLIVSRKHFLSLFITALMTTLPLNATTWHRINSLPSC